MERLAESRPIIRALYETSLKKDPSNKLASVKKFEEKLEQIQLETEALNANFKLSDDSISRRYLQLKDKRDNVVKNRKETTWELEQLKVRTSTDYQDYVAHCETEIRNIEEEWKRKLDAIKSKIDYENVRHKKRIEQLHNELEITQGAAALEQDEFETNSRRELVDLNAEIRHRQQLKQNLELDIEQIQQQINFYQGDTSNNLSDSVLDVFKLGQIEELYESPTNYKEKDPKQSDQTANKSTLSKEPTDLNPKTNTSRSLTKYQGSTTTNFTKNPQPVPRKRKVKSEEEDDITKMFNENKRKNHPAVVKRTLFSMDNLDYLNDLPETYSQSSDC